MNGNYENKSISIIKNNVKQETRILIGDFSILWNLYERNILDRIEKQIKKNKPDKEKDEKVYQENIHNEYINNLKSTYLNKNTEAKSVNYSEHLNFNDLENEINFNFKKIIDYFNTIENVPEFNANAIKWYFNINNPKGDRNNTNFGPVKELFDIFNNNKGKRLFEWDIFDKLHLLLIIIYRVRNNMYHGTKVIHKLDEQKDLFYIGNNIMSTLLGSKLDKYIQGKKGENYYG